MNKKIVIVSTMLDTQGIQQYSFDIVNTLDKMGYNVKFFVPDGKNVHVPKYIEKNTKKYEISNNPFSHIYKDVSLKICNENPNLVYFTSNTIYTYMIIRVIKKIKKINVSLAIHDVIQHPRHNQTIKQKIYLFYKGLINLMYSQKTFDFVNKIVLLSNNSYDSFCKLHPKLKNKAIVMKLVQHSTTEEMKCPNEILGLSRFFLCFGKIDKYKNVEELIEMFVNPRIPENFKLVIAGAGKISDDQYNKAINSTKIIIINRYIHDFEMNWLFKHCIATILPYIQATQSGVMTLAFTFCKPVIASNIRPFSDDIIEGVNGFLYNNYEEFYIDLEKVNNTIFLQSAEKYLKEYNTINLNQELVLKQGMDLLMNSKI